jgi:hypothetical protein
MTLMDGPVWRGKICSGGWVAANREYGGDAPVVEPAIRHEFGGTANLEAFTDTRWVTIRGDIAPYPF